MVNKHRAAPVDAPNMSERADPDRWYAIFRPALLNVFHLEFQDARWSFYVDRDKSRVVAFDRPHKYQDIAIVMPADYVTKDAAEVAAQVARDLREKAGRMGYIDQRKKPRR